MSEDNLIVVENLSRYYGTVRAVDDISFSVRRGEVLGFLGPNGAGKSTTMKIISGNLAPSAGRVVIDGHDILDEPRQAKSEIGYLPEQPPLYRELTVDEYLRYCAHLNRIASNRVSSAVDVAKQRCGLTGTGRRLIGNLSKGFQQRVGIAQAIIHSPSVVILDEPTVGLDPIQIREIRDLIKELGEQHSVILSTHILPEVQAICDQVQIIHKGQLVLNDSIEGLSMRMKSSALVIALRHPPASQRLADFAQVRGVDELGHGRYRLHFSPEDDPSQELVRTAVHEEWGLTELTPEKMDLEQVFVDLTSREEGGQHVQA